MSCGRGKTVFLCQFLTPPLLSWARTQMIPIKPLVYMWLGFSGVISMAAVIAGLYWVATR